MQATQIVGRILDLTPTYVWFIFAGLLALGIRRLKPRRTPITVAAAAPIGFAIWTVATLAALVEQGEGLAAIVTASVAAAIGFASGPFRLVPRPVHRGGGVFDFPATRWPLIFYMLLFWSRYALQVAAAIHPSQAHVLTLAGLALSALTAGRAVADFLPLVRMVRADRANA